jgi:flagellar hook assembly protein FlgD
MKRFNYKIVPPIMVIILLVYFTIDVWAKQSGIVGYTSTSGGGCQQSGCHGSSASSATSVTLTSGSLSVNPGSTNSYTIRVSNSNSSQTKAGINIAVKTTNTGSTNAGSLSPESGSGLQNISNELAHSSPKNLASGNADFSFTWTAPSTPGKYYLRAAGNAVDGNGGSSGDQWNWMSVQEIIVKGITLTEPTGTNLSYCVGSQVAIKWTQTGVSNVKIELSTNGGASWTTTIEPSIDAASGLYNWTIPASVQPGNQLKIRVSDASNSDLNSEMSSNFSLGGSFAIIGQPQSKEICAGNNHNLKVSVSGVGMKFQWYRNNTIITGATDSTYSITNANSDKAGSYKVVVSSSCQADVTSELATITVLPAPIITTQPKSVNVCSGTSATFNLEASGDNITYQWYFNTKKITDATSKQFIINAVVAADGGSYYCELTSPCGVLKSNNVDLSVNIQPEILSQPANVTICENGKATFTVEATGLENIYDWYFNGEKLNVPVNKTLTIDNVKAVNAGAYYCIITNPCGEPQTSTSATLSVNLAPVIKIQPQNKSVTVGDKVELSVSAENGTLSYQWKKNNANIDNAKSAKFEIAVSKKEDAGDYECVVTNGCGSVNSTKVKLNVDDPVAGASIRFTSAAIDLGKIFTDDASDSTFSNFITNNGNAELVISNIKVTGANAELFTVTIGKTTLQKGEATDLNVKFSSTVKGMKTAKIEFTTNTKEGLHTVDLLVNSVKLDVTPSTSTLDFANVEIGKSNTIEFKIANQGDEDITISSSEIGCSNKTEFEIISPSLPVEIKSKTEQIFKVSFNPTAESSFDCSVDFKIMNTDKSITLNVKGMGVVSSVEDNNLISNFNIYPNPVNDNVSMEFSSVESSQYILNIIDINGKILKEFSGNTSENSVRIDWDGTNQQGNKVPAGTYMAILRSGNSTKTLNITIIK